MSDLAEHIVHSNGSHLVVSEKFDGETSASKGDTFTLAVKIIILLLLICGIVEFLVYKFLMPAMQNPIVSVSGQRNYTPEEIVALLRPMDTKNWFSFDVNSAVAIISSNSGIDSVSVRKSFPNKIYITIVERESVATTFINSGEKSVAFEIDRNGIVFSEKSDRKKQNAPIPIVSGIPVEHLREGMRIPLKYRALIEQISSLPKTYFAALSEICVTPKEYGNYELVLIPSKAKIRVLTDRILNEDALKYMMVVLDVVTANEPDVYEIDLRYGSVSYRKR